MKCTAANAIAAMMALLVLFTAAAAADPMRCSTENEACAAACKRFEDQKVWRACVTVCVQRQSTCQRTGCWDNGTTTYCGLLRR
jgi:major membrane immunogen (membrane-anchored lipoprotein)